MSRISDDMSMTEVCKAGETSGESCKRDLFAGKKIALVTAGYCGACKDVKQHIKETGKDNLVPFLDFDVDDAQQLFPKELSSRITAIPSIVDCSQMKNGDYSACNITAGNGPVKDILTRKK